jgi:hypothetical protein
MSKHFWQAPVVWKDLAGHDLEHCLKDRNQRRCDSPFLNNKAVQRIRLVTTVYDTRDCWADRSVWKRTRTTHPVDIQICVVAESKYISVTAHVFADPIIHFQAQGFASEEDFGRA